MIRKMAFLIMVTVIFVSMNMSVIEKMNKNHTEFYFEDLTDEYKWAKEAIDELCDREIVSGLEGNLFMPASFVTKEQTAKMIAVAFDMTDNSGVQSYIDVLPDRWSFEYIEATKDILVHSNNLDINIFGPESLVTRAEFTASVAKAIDNFDKNLSDVDVSVERITDYNDISTSLLPFIEIAAKHGIINSSGGYFRPNDYVTRAEACVFLHRAMLAKEGKKDMSGEKKTPIIDDAHITHEQASKWATARGAHQRFIDIAPLYWEYAEKTGINPEIMYAQAAKETNFGKYTGNVRPEQNNWAGIKIYSPLADRPEDHETFASPEDGVRAHFNHMCAYVGTEPVGLPHERYDIVKNLEWAGEVKYAEELGTKWAPDPDYGYSLISNYVTEMRE